MLKILVELSIFQTATQGTTAHPPISPGAKIPSRQKPADDAGGSPPAMAKIVGKGQGKEIRDGEAGQVPACGKQPAGAAMQQ
jgi:hypothetical protein